MHPDIESVLLSEEEISRRVTELGRQISADYAGQEILLIGILKGAVTFLADLARQIDLPVHFDFMAISSYGEATTSSGVVRFLKDLEDSIENRHVLIVEDIVDTGLTLHYLRENLLARHPASLKVCALLDKVERRQVHVPVEYVGFQVPNEFLVGYGLDVAGRFRNLPYIAIVKREVSH